MSISNSKRALALVPFGYLATTRLKSGRDFAFLVATSWLPAIWLVIRLGGLEPISAIAAFIIGYLAFVAIYELGYLINDLWDARRSDGGRTRFAYDVSQFYLGAFVAIRLAVWAAVAWLTDWVSSPIWLTGYLVLLIAIAQHNLARSTALRLASFLELAILRFLLPILAIIPPATLWIVILIAMLLYAYPRFLAYMDSKGVLQLKERRDASFGASQLVWLAPLLLFVAYAASAAVIAELLAYFIFAYALGSIGFSQRKPQDS